MYSDVQNLYIHTMMTTPSFKAMFKRIKFNDAVANVLIDTEGIDSMTKLDNITATRASKLTKSIRSPGGMGMGAHVTEGER